MSDFLNFFAEKVRYYPMHLEVYYSKITDWSIHVWRRNNDGGDEEIVFVQGCDAELVFAKAQVELKEWLSEHEGGY